MEAHLAADIFSADYKPDVKATVSSPWMRWSDFRSAFASQTPAVTAVSRLELPEDGLDPAERWAREKMRVTAGEVYDPNQTPAGIWACFNQSTRAFKGLVQLPVKALDRRIRRTKGLLGNNLVSEVSPAFLQNRRHGDKPLDAMIAIDFGSFVSSWLVFKSSPACNHSSDRSAICAVALCARL